MVRDYMDAKSRVRHYTPDLGNRRVKFQNHKGGKAADDGKKQDRLILEVDGDGERPAQLEYEPVAKFRSAMNTPYQSRERTQLKAQVAQQRNAEKEERTLCLRNEAEATVTFAAQS